jgi:hypothetical protein
MIVQNQFPLGGNNTNKENGNAYTTFFIGLLVVTTIIVGYRFLPDMIKNEKMKE